MSRKFRTDNGIENCLWTRIIIQYNLVTLRISRLWPLVIFPTFYQIATHSTEILPESKQLVRSITVPNCPTFPISQGLSMDQFWTNSCGMKVSNIKIFEYFSLFKTSQGHVSWRSESSNVSLAENQKSSQAIFTESSNWKYAQV